MVFRLPKLPGGNGDVIWAPEGEKRHILAAKMQPRAVPGGPKGCPRRPKGRPRRPQGCQKGGQGGPKWRFWEHLRPQISLQSEFMKNFLENTDFSVDLCFAGVFIYFFDDLLFSRQTLQFSYHRWRIGFCRVKRAISSWIGRSFRATSAQNLLLISQAFLLEKL